MNKLLGIIMTALAFSLVVAVCYLWGYWGTFDIDIMYYLDLSELIVMSAVPLLGICVMLILCISISSILNIDGTNETNNSVLGSFLRQELIYTLSLLAIIIIVIIGGTAQWLLLAIPFSLFLTTFIVTNGSIFNKLLENRELFFVVLIATMLPSLAFGYGKTQGLQIETGTKYQQAVISNNSELGSRSDLRYLGKAGEHVFLLDGNSRELLITAQNDNQQLILSKASVQEQSTSPE